METFTKNVRDISLPDKLALEHVIGQPLAENQQVTIQIYSLDRPSEPPKNELESNQGLPEWCNVYAGLSDEQVGSVEQIALRRANLTRASD